MKTPCCVLCVSSAVIVTSSTRRMRWREGHVKLFHSIFPSFWVGRLIAQMSHQLHLLSRVILIFSRTASNLWKRRKTEKKVGRKDTHECCIHFKSFYFMFLRVYQFEIIMSRYLYTGASLYVCPYCPCIGRLTLTGKKVKG